MPPEKGLFIPIVASFSRLTDDANARKPLSFHGINTFGFIDLGSSSLCRMAQITGEVQTDGGNIPQHPSSYAKASDPVSDQNTPRLLFLDD